MKDRSKTKQKLILELASLRMRVADLERSEEECKRAELDLQEKTVIAQAFMDALPSVAMLLKTGTREIVALNKAASEAGAQPGATCFESWPKFNKACPFCLAPDAWKTVTPQRREVAALGRIREAHWVPVTEELYLHYVIDITDRKHAEDELRRSEENYRSIFENANDAIFIVQDGLFRLANSKTLTMSGYTLEELFDIPFIDLVHPDDRTQLLELHKKRMNGEPVSDYNTCRIFHKNGHIRLVEANAVVISWEGKPASLAFVRDITEQESLKEALIRSERLSALGMLSSGLAHELKNPLAIISSCSQFCLEKKPSPEMVADNIRIIYRNSLRANALINNLLNIARPLHLELKLLNIRDVLTGMLMVVFLGEEKSNAPIKYQTIYAKELPLIMGDEDALTLAFLNIFNNAIRVSRNILIETHHISSQNVVRVDITDDGPGIPEENRNRVFDPFFTTEKGGTGLGLSISHSIVQEHGGTIEVVRGKKVGTTVSVILPVAPKGSNESVKESLEKRSHQFKAPKEKKNHEPRKTNPNRNENPHSR